MPPVPNVGSRSPAAARQIVDIARVNAAIITENKKRRDPDLRRISLSSFRKIPLDVFATCNDMSPFIILTSNFPRGRNKLRFRAENTISLKFLLYACVHG